MGLTRVSGDILQTPLNVGVVTASEINVGHDVNIHSAGFSVGTSDLHSTGLTVQNLNATGVITATSFIGDGSALTGIDATALKDSDRNVKIQANTSGAVVTGVLTATSFSGDGTNLTNTGSTLSTADGLQRVVLTGQTSGTMTASATSASLTFNASSGSLSATSFSGSGANLTGIAVTENVRTNSLVVSGISTFAVGSASTPSITPTGFSTTGIFFPSGNNISFSLGGAEKFRLISTDYTFGHFTNSPGTLNAYKPSFSSYRSTTGSTSAEPSDSTSEQGSWNNKIISYNQIIQTLHGYQPSSTNRAVVGLYSYAANNGSGDNSFPTGGSGTSYWTPNGCAIWGNSGGAVGNQGTASIRADFQSYYYSGSAFYARVLNGVTSGVGYGLHVDLGGHPFGGRQVGVYVRQMDNQTMTGNAGYVYKRHNTSNTFWVLQVENGAGSTIGGITCTNTNTAFPTSSDYRLKENVIPLTGAIDKVKQIPVHRFNFIASPEITQDGFLAHELKPIVPIAVDGDKDEVETLPKKDENGNFIYNGEGDERTPIFKTVPKYQTVDYSKVVPLLTAALQEALTEIETLKARLDAAGL
jgi:hypothetical protein